MAQRRRDDYLKTCRELLSDRIERRASADADEGQKERNEFYGEDEEPDSKAPKACPRCYSKELVFIERWWPGQNYDHLHVSVLSTSSVPHTPVISYAQAIPP